MYKNNIYIYLGLRPMGAKYDRKWPSNFRIINKKYVHERFCLYQRQRMNIVIYLEDFVVSFPFIGDFK